MPSITDEIMQMAEEYALLRESNIRGRTRQKHRERLRSRLTALETELEGYRKRDAVWLCTSSGEDMGTVVCEVMATRNDALAWLAGQHRDYGGSEEGLSPIEPECVQGLRESWSFGRGLDDWRVEKWSVGRSEGGASLRRQDGAGEFIPPTRVERPALRTSIVQPSDLAASHPLHPEPVSLSSSGSALPCPSDYVNAQSGYSDEDGG